MLHSASPLTMTFSLETCVYSLNSVLLGCAHLVAALDEWKSRNHRHDGSCDTHSQFLTLTRVGSVPDNADFETPIVAGCSGMSRDSTLLLLRGMTDVGSPLFKTPDWLKHAIGGRTIRARMLVVDDLGSSFVPMLCSWVKSMLPQLEVRVLSSPPQPLSACGYIAASAVADMSQSGCAWFDSPCTTRFQNVVYTGN